MKRGLPMDEWGWELIVVWGLGCFMVGFLAATVLWLHMIKE